MAALLAVHRSSAAIAESHSGRAAVGWSVFLLASCLPGNDAITSSEEKKTVMKPICRRDPSALLGSWKPMARGFSRSKMRRLRLKISFDRGQNRKQAEHFTSNQANLGAPQFTAYSSYVGPESPCALTPRKSKNQKRHGY